MNTLPKKKTILKIYEKSWGDNNLSTPLFEIINYFFTYGSFDFLHFDICWLCLAHSSFDCHYKFNYLLILWLFIWKI